MKSTPENPEGADQPTSEATLAAAHGSAARVQKLERAVKDTIMAIEGGTEINDHRGKVYQQQFGEAFVMHLKSALEMPPNE